METVIISGAAGFLGSHLTDLFLERNYRVIGIDNLITGRARNLDHLRETQNFFFIRHDIIEPLEIEGSIRGVLHLASPASPPDYLDAPIETLRVGSEGTRNMLDLALAHDATFLLASTSEVYGDPLEHPQRETYWGNVNPVGPRSVYDEAKRYAEALTMAYHRAHGVDTRIVRIFNTYGPRLKPNDGRVVTNFIVQALKGEPLTIYGDGSQTRSFCYVSDEIEGLFRLFQSSRHEPTNIGNPEEFTIRELADIIIKLTATTSSVRHLPLPKDDPTTRQPDITVARELLEWEPKIPLKEGLEKTIAHFRALLEEEGPALLTSKIVMAKE